MVKQAFRERRQSPVSIHTTWGDYLQTYLGFVK